MRRPTSRALLSRALVLQFLAVLGFLGVCAVGSSDTMVGPIVGPSSLLNLENGQLTWPAECNQHRPLSDSAAIVPDPLGSGSNVLRVSVGQGDTDFGYNESCEVSRPIPDDGQSSGFHQYHAVAPDEGQGTDYWYHLAVKFDIQSPAGGWRTFLEWHGWDGYSAPVSLSYDFNDLKLSLFAGQLAGDSGLPATANTKNTLAPGKGLAINVPFGLNRPGEPGMLDQWHDILIHVRWTPFGNQGGFVEVYHKYADESSYQEVIDLHSTPGFPNGIPTMHATSLDSNGNPSVRTLTNYMLLGYYRQSYCVQPTAPTAWKDPAACGSTQGIQPTDTLYFDDFAQGPTMQSVDPTAAVANAQAPRPLSFGEHESAATATRGTAGVSGFDTVTDRGCQFCQVDWAGSDVWAQIEGGRDNIDTAYALEDFGGPNGWPGRTYTRDLLRLGVDQTLAGNLSVFQLRDVHNALIYELYLSPDRRLHLWSPAGGLSAREINESSGVVVPNDRKSELRVEVSALAGDSVIVRINGREKIVLTGLRGARTGRPRYLRSGIDHYDGTSPFDVVAVFHKSVGISTNGWLGKPETAPLAAASETPRTSTPLVLAGAAGNCPSNAAGTRPAGVAGSIAARTGAALTCHPKPVAP